MPSQRDYDICLSGGARGADLQWGMCAGRDGQTVIHWSFEGHRTGAPAVETVCLTKEQLAEADAPARLAGTTLRKHYPPSGTLVRKLLQRNWFQVKDAERVYAVAGIDGHGLVKGGTGWAVQMFLNRFAGLPCPAYVFDQEACRWHEWQGTWQPIYSPPRPQGVWAGIGTRDLDLMGKLAIRVLLDQAWRRPAA